ncbi:MAG TPA: class F sortase [Actinomycetota bacterium]|nr:class F sortase [Actinomycetota bacterium]
MTSGRLRLAAGTAALALLVGCSEAGARRGEPSPAATSQAPDQAASGVDAARRFRSARGYRATPVPARIEIPKIHVASSLDRLGQAPDGTVEVPGRWEVAGWYALGPRPGDPGSAVILGHVDSKRGPAVFFRLRELRRGDEIKVTRADGSTVRFAVERTEQYDKQRFPTDDVYYPTLTSGLRLVTCGGQFDDATGHYRSNIIVFAAVRT